MRQIAILGIFFLVLVQVSAGFDIKIIGYEGGNVTVNIIPIGNATFSQNITVQNDTISILNMTEGDYHVVVNYGVKQFVTTISIPENTSVVVDFSETSDLNVIRADNYHYILNYQDNRYVVMEVAGFENTGDKYFRGDIIKKIPENVEHVIVDENTLAQNIYYENLTVEKGRIVIKNATIQPNWGFSLAYMYFPANSLDLVIDYPFEVVRIIHPAEIKVEPPEGFVQETQITNNQGVIFNVLKFENPPINKYVIKAELSLDQTMKSGVESGRSSTSGINIPLIAGAILVVLGAVLFLFSRKSGSEKDEEESDWEISK